MTDILATTGSVQFDKGLPGQLADETEAFVDSFYNESTTGGVDSAGAIDFGVAAAQGSGGDNHCKVVSANGDTVVGITTRLPLMAASASTNVVGWRSQHEVGVLKFGVIFAIPYEDVRKNDQVLALVAQAGRLAGSKGGPAGTGRLVVTGARWMDTTTAGQVGRIEVIGREAIVTTS